MADILYTHKGIGYENLIVMDGCTLGYIALQER